MNNLTEINDNMPLSELEKERIKRIAHLLCNEKIENCSIELNEEQYALFIDEWNKERQNKINELNDDKYEAVMNEWVRGQNKLKK